MNTWSVLEATLNEILGLLNPLTEDWEIRWKVINEFRDVVGTVESLRGATVEPFGSFVSNLFTPWGDLDISVELSNGSFISSPGKKHKLTLLGDVFRQLRRKGGMHRLQFVRHARVPILNFQSNYQNISCDISVNNLSGHMKSKFLLWISIIDRRFRDLVLLVKEWAKTHDINNPKTGTFNSYSLTLLVIFHLQTCVPAILPPLKELYPGNMADDLTGVRADVERTMEEVCAANIAMFRRSRRVNQSSLSELFVSFFAKLSDIDVRALELGVSTFTGCWESISTNTTWLPKTYALYVEDPFDQRENTARAVNAKQLTRAAEVIRATHLSLISPSLNRISLFRTLLQPHITRLPNNHSNFSAGRNSRTVPHNNSNIGVGDNFRTAFNGFHGPRTPSQPQRDFQNRMAPNFSRNVVAGNSGSNFPYQGRGVSNTKAQVQVTERRPTNYNNTGRAARWTPVQLSQGQGNQVTVSRATNHDNKGGALIRKPVPSSPDGTSRSGKSERDKWKLGDPA